MKMPDIDLDPLNLIEDDDCDVNISWNSKRLITSFKKLIFFSEIFPKKYQNEFMDELLKEQQNNYLNKKALAVKNPDNLNYNYKE